MINEPKYFTPTAVALSHAAVAEGVAELVARLVHLMNNFS